MWDYLLLVDYGIVYIWITDNIYNYVQYIHYQLALFRDEYSLVLATELCCCIWSYLWLQCLKLTFRDLICTCVTLCGRIKDAARSLSKINHSRALTHPHTVLNLTRWQCFNQVWLCFNYRCQTIKSQSSSRWILQHKLVCTWTVQDTWSMPKQQGQEIIVARLHPGPPYSAQPRTEACTNLLVAPLDYLFLSLTQRTAML